MTHRALSATLSLVALTSATACLPSSPYDDYCGGASYRAEYRALEDDLRALEGTPQTYTASNADGTLEVELTIRDVSEQFAYAPTHPLVRLADLTTDLLVSRAHAECGEPSASARATYTATWTTNQGDARVLSQSSDAFASYRNGYDSGYVPDGRRVLSVGDQRVTITFEKTSDTSELTLTNYSDPDNPDARMDAHAQ
jgi:hypothetical protein